MSNRPLTLIVTVGMAATASPAVLSEGRLANLACADDIKGREDDAWLRDFDRRRLKEAGPDRSPEAALAVGKWNVEFTNGVTEVCVVGRGGTAVVDEPRRRSRGTVAAQGGSVVMTFHDDRVERWTPVGKRFVVEHFFPGSGFPTATPVLGIAERTPRGRWAN
jgi:hypothetical protein